MSRRISSNTANLLAEYELGTLIETYAKATLKISDIIFYDGILTLLGVGCMVLVVIALLGIGHISLLDIVSVVVVFTLLGTILTGAGLFGLVNDVRRYRRRVRVLVGTRGLLRLWHNQNPEVLYWDDVIDISWRSEVPYYKVTLDNGNVYHFSGEIDHCEKLGNTMVRQFMRRKLIWLLEWRMCTLQFA